MTVNPLVGTLRPFCKGSVHEMACLAKIGIVFSIIVCLIPQDSSDKEKHNDNSKDENYIFCFSQCYIYLIYRSFKYAQIHIIDLIIISPFTS